MVTAVSAHSNDSMPYLSSYPTPPPKTYLLHVLKKRTVHVTHRSEGNKAVTDVNQVGATKSVPAQQCKSPGDVYPCA